MTKGGNGFTVTFIRWDDGELWVAGRFDTEEEVDEFLHKIHKPGSGWTPEELDSISVLPGKDANPVW